MFNFLTEVLANVCADILVRIIDKIMPKDDQPRLVIPHASIKYK